MDNDDLSLVVAEMLIEMQQLKARMALLESTFAEVRDDLTAIRENTHEAHQEIVGQSNHIRQILARVQAIITERNEPGGLPPAGPAPAADEAETPQR